MTPTISIVTKCRHCGTPLAGEMYRYVYNPDTKIEAKQNQFGGYVCSRTCDVRECLSMLGSMPGAGPAMHLDSPCEAQVIRNWG
jgi:hypothetical protein